MSKSSDVDVKDIKEVKPKSERHDLTHYVKDRVELMRQVFGVVREKEVCAMAPNHLRHLDAVALQEMLLDEVLGISSARLRSVLDGNPCPTDTESSEDENVLETISLDSISSIEDEIVTRPTKAKKLTKKKTAAEDETKLSKKRKREKLKKSKQEANKSNAKKSIVPPKEEKDQNNDGMTVLELIELQARARAIRAQLAAVEIKYSNKSYDDVSNDASDSDADEVIIKEEPTEVVEIASSSEEDDTNKNVAASDISTNVVAERKSRKISTIKPQKFKLNRNNPLSKNIDTDVDMNEGNKQNTSDQNQSIEDGQIEENTTIQIQSAQIKETIPNVSSEKEKPLSDGDEISLDLSDTEKMDVLDGLRSPVPVRQGPSKETLVESVEISKNKIFSSSHKKQKKSDKKIKRKNITTVTKPPEDVIPEDELIICDSPELDLNSTDTLDLGHVDDTNIKETPACEESVNVDSKTVLISDTDESAVPLDMEISVDRSKTIEQENSAQEINLLNTTTKIECAELKDSDSIFEISDTSDDDASMLSKEPTRDEIIEFSKKIESQIEKEDFLDSQTTTAPEENQENTDSWKSRWLKSYKVQKILATSNLCNALRKKNRELKKKLERDVTEAIPDPVPMEVVAVEVSAAPDEGSVSHYETLPSCTKYAEPIEKTENVMEKNELSMVDDAKQLLKMYKKLLKINDNSTMDKAQKKKLKKDKKEKKKMKKDKKKLTKSLNESNDSSVSIQASEKKDDPPISS